MKGKRNVREEKASLKQPKPHPRHSCLVLFSIQLFSFPQTYLEFSRFLRSLQSLGGNPIKEI